MSTVADSRKQVLDRIRAATRNSAATAEQAADAYAALAREYVRRGSMSAEARLERMVERLREYDAEVVECHAGGAVRSDCRAVGGKRQAQVRGTSRDCRWSGSPKGSSGRSTMTWRRAKWSRPRAW